MAQQGYAGASMPWGTQALAPDAENLVGNWRVTRKGVQDGSFLVDINTTYFFRHVDGQPLVVAGMAGLVDQHRYLSNGPHIVTELWNTRSAGQWRLAGNVLTIQWGPECGYTGGSPNCANGQLSESHQVKLFRHEGFDFDLLVWDDHLSLDQQRWFYRELVPPATNAAEAQLAGKWYNPNGTLGSHYALRLYYLSRKGFRFRSVMDVNVEYQYAGIRITTGSYSIQGNNLVLAQEAMYDCPNIYQHPLQLPEVVIPIDMGVCQTVGGSGTVVAPFQTDARPGVQSQLQIDFGNGPVHLVGATDQ